MICHKILIEMDVRKINLLLLSIWWGAFTFYSGEVINVDMQVLGNHTEMGFITQAVTGYINSISLPIFYIYGLFFSC